MPKLSQLVDKITLLRIIQQLMMLLFFNLNDNDVIHTELGLGVPGVSKQGCP